MKSEIDTCNFDKFEEEEPWVVEDKQRKGKKNNRNVRIPNDYFLKFVWF